MNSWGSVPKDSHWLKSKCCPKSGMALRVRLDPPDGGQYCVGCRGLAIGPRGLPKKGSSLQQVTPQNQKRVRSDHV